MNIEFDCKEICLIWESMDLYNVAGDNYQRRDLVNLIVNYGSHNFRVISCLDELL
jgi:hypothetical protein